MCCVFGATRFPKLAQIGIRFLRVDKYSVATNAVTKNMYNVTRFFRAQSCRCCDDASSSALVFLTRDDVCVKIVCGRKAR